MIISGVLQIIDHCTNIFILEKWAKNKRKCKWINEKREKTRGKNSNKKRKFYFYIIKTMEMWLCISANASHLMKWRALNPCERYAAFHCWHSALSPSALHLVVGWDVFSKMNWSSFVFMRGKKMCFTLSECGMTRKGAKIKRYLVAKGGKLRRSEQKRLCDWMS